MKKEQIQEYTLRITQANRSELVVILYEVTECYIADAIKAFDEGDTLQYKRNIEAAIKCVSDLMDSLNFDYELALPLMNIYLYIRKELYLAIIRNKTDILIRLPKLISSLKEAFVNVSSADGGDAMMENTQSVYAGYTYGKGVLVEGVSDNSGNRGYMA